MTISIQICVWLFYWGTLYSATIKQRTTLSLKAFQESDINVFYFWICFVYLTETIVTKMLIYHMLLHSRPCVLVVVNSDNLILFIFIFCFCILFETCCNLENFNICEPVATLSTESLFTDNFVGVKIVILSCLSIFDNW